MKCFRRDRWDGAVYYGIRQFDTREGRKYYLLLVELMPLNFTSGEN
jgi:hypothetical protein